ncbi:MAG: CpaD family pilus assembly lipoprotein [Pseudomonadota bacterium]
MRLAISATALVIGATLSGCMGVGTPGAMNRSLESVHQPIVRVANYALDVAAPNGVLGPVEMRRVSDWLDAMEIGYGDTISVDDSGAYNARAARDGVAMMVTRKGLLLSDHAPLTSGAIAPGSIRVVITRSSAHVSGCPDWSQRMNANWGNNTSANYGCASNSNLAAMVADPTDLVSGQPGTTNDPNAATRAINTYRAATPTGAAGLPSSGTQGGGSSGGGR